MSKSSHSIRPDFNRILDHVISTEQISSNGLSGRIEADEAERQKIAELLGLVELTSFTLDYSISPLGKSRFELTGNLTADVTQECVVTLEPVRADIKEDILLEFWPENQLSQFASDRPEEGAELAPDEPEPIVEGQMDLGTLAYEYLSAALDPYPRKEGAAFDWQEEGDSGSAEPVSKPFAALEALKKP